MVINNYIIKNEQTNQDIVKESLINTGTCSCLQMLQSSSV